MKRFICMALSVFLLLAPLTAAQAKVTFAWMTDTQNYYGSALPAFEAMAEWTVAQAQERGVEFLAHTGDITNTHVVNARWDKADEILGRIEDAGIPVYAVAGNHDIGGKDRYGIYKAHRIEGRVPEAQCFNGGSCYYAEYEAADESMKLLIVCVSCYATREAGALEWIDGVLKAHPDSFALILTHAYMAKNTRLIGDGLTLNALVAANPNVKLVLCGHARGVARRADEYDDDGDGVTDRTVNVVLANYQNLAARAGGYMRIVTVYPESRTVNMITYSPYLSDYGYFADDAEAFNLSY